MLIGFSFGCLVWNEMLRLIYSMGFIECLYRRAVALFRRPSEMDDYANAMSIVLPFPLYYFLYKIRMALTNRNLKVLDSL